MHASCIHIHLIEGMVTASSSTRDDQNDTADSIGIDLPADYKPYVPVAKRRAQLRSTLTGKQQQAKKAKVSTDELHRERIIQQDEDDEEEKAKEKARRERTLMQAAQEVKEKRALAGKHTWLVYG
jgi:fatty acid/phospholipid biosynthesis enzyme